jgi:hypothetical protein
MKTSRKRRTELSENVQETLQALFQRIGLPPLRERLLEEVLTKREARQVENANLAAHPATVARAILAVVASARKLSLKRALLEVAHRLGLVSSGRYEGLRQAIGEPVKRGAAGSSSSRKKSRPTVPRWDKDRGILWWGEQPIRRLRGCKEPSRLERIVNAFQENRWKRSIDSPFPEESRFLDIHEIVNDLNRGLGVIRFHVQAGVRQITWALKPK